MVATSGASPQEPSRLKNRSTYRISTFFMIFNRLFWS
jgi:hypothetical protein